MKQEPIERGELTYAPCRYGNSRMQFRGPRRDLDKSYLAFVGGSGTYGKFIEKPFPALVEQAIGTASVNLGVVNAGIDAYVSDTALMEICRRSAVTVVQVTGANYLSNRFYSVHPRRNDRFLKASTLLKTIYSGVDFSQFTFTRHLLGALYAASPDRFEIVVAELRKAWMARMTKLLDQIALPIVLLWFSEGEMSNDHWSGHLGKLQADPLFVTKDMIDALGLMVSDIVVVNPSYAALVHGTDGMVFGPSQTRLARTMLGVNCHREATEALIPALRKILLTK